MRKKISPFGRNGSMNHDTITKIPAHFGCGQNFATSSIILLNICQKFNNATGTFCLTFHMGEEGKLKSMILNKNAMVNIINKKELKFL